MDERLDSMSSEELLGEARGLRHEVERLQAKSLGRHEASALVKEIERLGLFPSRNPNPVLAFTGEGMVAYANGAAEPLLRALGTAVGAPLPEPWRARVIEAAQTGKTGRYDGTIDGLTYAFALAPIDEGRFVNAYGLDVTERRQAEDALREAVRRLDSTNQRLNATEQQLRASNQQLHAMNQQLAAAANELRAQRDYSRSIVETAQVIVLVLDPDGRVVDFNPYMTQLSGYSLDEARGKDWFTTFLPSSDREAVREVFHRAISTMSTHGNVNPIVTKAGELRLIEWYDRTLRNDDGSVKWLIAVGHDVTERERAAEKLGHHARLFEQISEAIISTDLSAVITTWGKGAERVYGWRADEAVGRTVSDLLDTQFVGVTREQAFEEVHRQGYWAGVVRQRRSDGSVRSVEASVNLVTDTAGIPTGLLAVNRDVTEEREAARLLAESEQRFRALFEGAGQGIGYYDREGNLLTLNRIAAENLGSSTGEELVGRSIAELFPGPGKEYLERLKRVAATGERLEFEDDGRLPGGERVFQSQYTPAIGDNGVCTGVIITSADLTEKHATQRALEDSLRKFAHFVSNSIYGYIETDMAGTVTFVNDRFCTISGYPPQELTGVGFRHLVWPDDLARVEERQGRIAAGEAMGAEEFRIRCRDGSMRFVQVNTLPLRVGETSAGLQFTVEDISERMRDHEEKRQLQEQLFQSQKMEAIGQLAGGIAHDFNNILGSICGYADLLKARNPTTEKRIHYATKIIENTTRGGNLTSQLLTYARKSNVSRAAFNLHTVIWQVVGILEQTIDPGVVVRQTLLARPSTVMGAAHMVQSALLNIALNARDAMPGGGVLSIDTDRCDVSTREAERLGPWVVPGSFVRVRMADCGHGMSPETLSRAFDPFFTTKEVGKGTGLGLAMVQGCIRDHGGEVSLESRPGRGTTVTLMLPALIEQKGETEGRDIEPVPGVGKVLFVDDEESFRDAMGQFLENLGYEVETCGDGEAAARVLMESDEHFDVVVMDLLMPVVSGVELLRRLRETGFDRPVIVSTGYGGEEEEKQVLALGVSAILRKPYRSAELSETLARVLAEGRRGKP